MPPRGLRVGVAAVLGMVFAWPVAVRLEGHGTVHIERADRVRSAGLGDVEQARRRDFQQAAKTRGWMTMARRLGLLVVVALVMLLAVPVRAEDAQPYNPDNPVHVAAQQELQAKENAKADAMRQEIVDQWKREGRAGLLDGQLVGDPGAVARQQERDSHAWVDPDGASHSFNYDGRDVSPTEYLALQAASDRQRLKEMRENRKRMKEEGASSEQESLQDAEDAKAEQHAKEREEARAKDRARYEAYRPKTLRSGD